MSLGALLSSDDLQRQRTLSHDGVTLFTKRRTDTEHYFLDTPDLS